MMETSKNKEQIEALKKMLQEKQERLDKIARGEPVDNAVDVLELVDEFRDYLDSTDTDQIESAKSFSDEVFKAIEKKSKEDIEVNLKQRTSEELKENRSDAYEYLI